MQNFSPYLNTIYKVKKLILIVVLTGFGLKGLASIPLSQQVQLPTYYNPAWAGADNERYAFMSYRNQWPGLGYVYNTYRAGYITPVSLLRGGVGFQLNRDDMGQGVFTTTWLDLIYSYGIQVDKDKAWRLSIQASVVQKNISSQGNINFPSWVDPAIYSQENGIASNQIYADFNLGAIYKVKDHYFGIGGFHLFEPNDNQFNVESVVARNFKLFYTGNFDVDKSKSKLKTYLRPIFLVNYNKYETLMFYGASIQREPNEFSIWLRQSVAHFDNTSVILAYNVLIESVKIGYSFDFMLGGGGFSLANFGAHEISLKYQLPYRHKNYTTSF